MSYLQLETGISDFSQAVISLWFRAPAASFAAAHEQFYALPDGSFDFNLRGIVPLVTFGPNATMVFYETFDGGQTYVIGGIGRLSPCFIGVRCGDNSVDESETISVLQARIQYSSGAPSPPVGFGPPGQATNITPDFFQVGGAMDGSNLRGGMNFADSIDVTPDRWHHVLVSFDMTPGAATSEAGGGLVNFDSVCKFWWAYDDVNYSGSYLWPYCALNYGLDGDENGIVSSGCMAAILPHTFDAGAIPTDGKPLGIPTSADNVDYVYPVEMAELQVFTGVTLDTSIEANRRAFITAAGTPADPLKKPNPPPPVPLPPEWLPPLKGPQELLGKDADILLHGSGNWIKGTNTGKQFKLNEIGKPSAVPTENLVPTGSIIAYSPDPSLHGAQSPPPPRPPVR